MIDKETAEAYRKMLYGEQSIHAAAHLIIQYGGPVKGQAFCTVAGLVIADLRHPVTQQQNFQHEFVRGDLVLRVQKRYTDDAHRGIGIANMLTDQGLFPEQWEYEINEQGILVPNPIYGDWIVHEEVG